MRIAIILLMDENSYYWPSKRVWKTVESHEKKSVKRQEILKWILSGIELVGKQSQMHLIMLFQTFKPFTPLAIFRS